MKRTLKLSFLLSALMLTSTVFAVPTSWLSTRYRASIYSTGSSYRSPVSEGHLDLRLLVDNVTFTDAEFSIRYDSAIVKQIYPSNLLDLMPGLTLTSLTTETLDGTWKKSTIRLTGNVTIGQSQYESDAVFRLRLIPDAEGTVPITLWPGGWGGRYPESYNTCSLSLSLDGQEVVHGRKEWNDGTTLFAFTGRADASVMYHFDLNFGTPLGGYLQVVYNDQSVEEFHVSDHDKGIMINPEFGAYFLTAQPNAASHTLIVPGYGQWGPLDLINGYYWSVGHSQPEMHLGMKEKYEGFYGVKATTEDLVLTIDQPGIGSDFENAVYTAAIAGDQTGILTKTFSFEYINDDTIRLTIEDGLEPDYNYNLYVFKNELVLGRTWFSASTYYPVTFTVKDENENPIPNALVAIPIWGMFGPSSIDQTTDQNGQAFFEMPGNSLWGEYHQYRVISAGYTGVSDYLSVYSDPVELTVFMEPAAGVNLNDFVNFSAWWGFQECSWNNDCDGADMNFDGNVDLEDLVLFVACWMKDINLPE